MSILDLSAAGRQPFTSAGGRFLVFNGELYNYRELREELGSRYAFRTSTDTEVVAAAFDVWGEECLDRFIGMFAFAVWDPDLRQLFAARDRFGVKPFFYGIAHGGLLFASEIKALRGSGIGLQPDPVTWSRYLMTGRHDGGAGTFWEGVASLPAGHALRWSIDAGTTVRRWYDFAARVGPAHDSRVEADVVDEYRSLLLDSISLRFRADVPVGINLSGGLDSSALLALVQSVQGRDSDVQAFTFATGDPKYDETSFVHAMLASTQHPSVVANLRAADVPDLARSVQSFQDEPFGGVPTLAYARLFEAARDHGVTVLLDGQGMDEQWAGYDYYRAPAHREVPIVQGSNSSSIRPSCVMPDFSEIGAATESQAAFDDRLRSLQYRDLFETKLPRALRFNDRVSMRAGRELREPFLDHRLVELAVRQPAERKVDDTTGKVLLRRLVRDTLPSTIVDVPKRPVQTPQREWLRGELRPWAADLVESALSEVGGSWLDARACRSELQRFFAGEGDNSHFVWQWVSLGLILGD